MHGSACRYLLFLALVGLVLPLPVHAQPAPTTTRQGVPLPPEGESIIIPVSTSRRFTVEAPWKILPSPYVEREEVVTLQYGTAPDAPAAQAPPDSFILVTSDLVGATNLVLPMVNEDTGERVVRRIEILVIDEISQAYKAYLESAIRDVFPTATAELLVPNASTIILKGYVEKAEQIAPIENLVRGFLAARTGATTDTVTVVNALRVTGAQQVQLRVVMAEVNRTRVRALGFDWAWEDLGSGLIGAFGASTGGFFPEDGIGLADPLIFNTAGANMPFRVTRANQFAFFGLLRALENHGLGKILAEPVLVATSGQPAFFNVGQEIPVIKQGSLGSVDVEYKPVGTNVRFVPTVLGDGRIRLEVRPEVSERIGEVVVGGSAAPLVGARTVETTVELENGQTFAVAGLVQQRIDTSAAQIPFMANLPLVGWAFQNKSYTQEETELLIMVTPHLVAAMDERPCKLPGRSSRVPNDVEFYLGNKFEPPCFKDPYRNHYQKHFQKVPPPVPVPVRPYDNYGRPPAAAEFPMTPVPAPSRVPPAPPSAPASPVPAAPAPTAATFPRGAADLAGTARTPAWQGTPAESPLPAPEPLDLRTVQAVDADLLVPPLPQAVTHNPAVVPQQQPQAEPAAAPAAPAPATTADNQGWRGARQRMERLSRLIQEDSERR